MCAVAGCNETDPDPLYIDVVYQMRCKDCEPRTNDSPVRDIHYLDGDQGFALECGTSAGDDGTLISFSAVYTDPENPDNTYGLHVDQAGLDGASASGACSVKVDESGSVYEGRCSNSAPTSGHPCQVKLATEGTTVTGTINCDKIPIQDMMEPFRYFKKPNSDNAADIEIRGCVL